MNTPEIHPASSTALEVHHMLRHARTASLGTISVQNGGPYVSLVNIATTLEGLPLLFLSRLAWHTQNILADAKASLLVHARLDDPREDPLTTSRISLMGTLRKVEAAPYQSRYLAHHPLASHYVDLPDFSFWVLQPSCVHCVAGFGRIKTLDAAEVFSQGPA